MIKILIPIIAMYLLYYAGNIIYDLFLKKDISKGKEETEEYAFIGLAEQNNDKIKDVGIDDVENINTPNSFIRKELFPKKEAEPDDSGDLDYWRKKFESEQDIDSFDNVPEIKGQPEEKKQKEIAGLDLVQEEHIENEEKKDSDTPQRNTFHEQFKNFLNLAETSVQILSELDGHKVYQSAI